jgi:hypothetical protein
MKLRKLEAPIEKLVGAEGVSVFISHVGVGRSGLPVARATVWNGQVLACAVAELDKADERRKLVKEACSADPETLSDPAVLETALRECAEALHQHAPAQVSGLKSGDADGRPSARFDGLVDIVAHEDGEPVFLVLDPAGDCGVSIVEAYTPESGPDAGITLVPPPARSLPWLLPRGAEVLRYITAGGDDDAELFADIVACLKRHARLPTLTSCPDAYYELCAAWEFHTHYLEHARYSPMLAFYAAPERGKSRTGRTLSYVARRGIHTETLREANLFRDSQDRGATLFIDCVGLWKKAEKLGCEDILLQRFERGAQVSRVLNPDRGPFHDTTYFDIFGPTILASNEPLGRILDTRCVPISMPLAPEIVEYPVPDEAAVLPLRERLTAWRARQLLANWKPDGMAKPAASRLGDVLLPLAQTVAHVAPDRLPNFLALAGQLEAARRRERALSLEALVVAAIRDLVNKVSNGKLLVDEIAQHVNAGRSERECLSNRKITGVLTSLGLTTDKAHKNKAALLWDENKIVNLMAYYAGAEESGDAQEQDMAADVGKSSGKTEGVGFEKAIEAVHAKALGPGPYSVDSVYSVSNGDRGPDLSEISDREVDQRGDSPASTAVRLCVDCGEPTKGEHNERCASCYWKSSNLGGQLLRYGERLGWPELPFKPGHSIGAGEEAWRKFSQTAPRDLLQKTIDAAKGEVEAPF